MQGKKCTRIQDGLNKTLLRAYPECRFTAFRDDRHDKFAEHRKRIQCHEVKKHNLRKLELYIGATPCHQLQSKATYIVS